MNKTEIKIIKQMLINQLATTEKMWDEKRPHAEIVGYLQGTIKSTINILDNKLQQK